MIELSHISKSFGGRLVLAEVSLRVQPGEMLYLSGPSGCGKTTLLEIIAGISRPDSGARRVQSRRTGYAMQDDCLLPWYSAEDNVIFALSAFFKPQQARAECARWLAAFGLAEARSAKPGALSGGMRRRLNIARSFAAQPDLLLLDEPFAFQDQGMIETIARETLAVNSALRTTIVLVSHDRRPDLLPGCRTMTIDQSPAIIG